MSKYLTEIFSSHGQPAMNCAFFKKKNKIFENIPITGFLLPLPSFQFELKMTSIEHTCLKHTYINEYITIKT